MVGPDGNVYVATLFNDTAVIASILGSTGKLNWMSDPIWDGDNNDECYSTGITENHYISICITHSFTLTSLTPPLPLLYFYYVLCSFFSHLAPSFPTLLLIFTDFAQSTTTHLFSGADGASFQTFSGKIVAVSPILSYSGSTSSKI